MEEVKPLVEVFEIIPDPRQAGGQRYQLSGLLMLVSVAMLCGYDSLNQIAILFEGSAPTLRGGAHATYTLHLTLPWQRISPSPRRTLPL
jgi:hypothetical protein